MELADDAQSAEQINATTYAPKTLSSEKVRIGRVPPAECVQIALSLSSALAHLHRHALIHRDIKPSNVIFVGGKPKFADIGLVTRISDDATFVGTPGFVPPEGPGKPTADLYSLGMLLYGISMGKSAKEFPMFPTQIAETDISPQLWALNEIIVRACDKDVPRRFQSADQIHAALALIATKSPAPKDKSPVKSRATNEGDFTKFIKPPRVSILYKSNVQPDVGLLELLHRELSDRGCNVFFDRHLAIGVEWAREIESRIRESDAVIVLLSGPTEIS